MKKMIFASLIALPIVTPLFAEESIVFTGLPTVKISEGGTSRVPEAVTKDKAVRFKCTITKIDDKYYWTSRENTELLPISSGAFVTYWAVNGSGYVRVVRPDMKAELKRTPAVVGDPEAKFEYVEHLLLGLKSVTYYGTSK
jgi:hypothetical protein